MINKEYFSKIDTHNKAYTLGLIAADGSIKNKYIARIALRDKEILEHISLDIYMGENRVTQHKNNGMYCLNLCSKDLVETLNNHGIIPNKTDKLEHLVDVPDKFYNSFVLGYLDGDGTVNTKRENAKLQMLGTFNFLSAVCHRVKELCGVEGRIYFMKNHLYSLEYSGSNKVKPFIKWLYSGDSFCLDRKKDKALLLLNRETLKENTEKTAENYLKSGLSMVDFAKINNINYYLLRSRVRRYKLNNKIKFSNNTPISIFDTHTNTEYESINQVSKMMHNTGQATGPWVWYHKIKNNKQDRFKILE